MKKHIMIFLLIFFITIGFATLSTVLDIKGNANIAENLEDFKIEITNLKINDINQASLISNDKKSFTFTGSANDTLEYTVTNYSYQYDTNINLVCTPNDNVTIEQINNLSAQNRITKTINTTNTSEITCTINVEKVSRTDYAEEIESTKMYIIENAKEKVQMSTYYQNHSSGSLDYGSEYIIFNSGDPYVYGNYTTLNKVDLTDYNYLHFNGYINVNNYASGHLFISNNKNTDCVSICYAYGGISDGLVESSELQPDITSYTIDISELNGTYYIGFLGSARKIYIKDLWLDLE